MVTAANGLRSLSRASCSHPHPTRHLSSRQFEALPAAQPTPNQVTWWWVIVGCAQLS